jgi:hypothetical protein
MAYHFFFEGIYSRWVAKKRMVDKGGGGGRGWVDKEIWRHFGKTFDKKFFVGVLTTVLIRFKRVACIICISLEFLHRTWTKFAGAKTRVLKVEY